MKTGSATTPVPVCYQAIAIRSDALLHMAWPTHRIAPTILIETMGRMRLRFPEPIPGTADYAIPEV